MCYLLNCTICCNSWLSMNPHGACEICGGIPIKQMVYYRQVKKY